VVVRDIDLVEQTQHVRLDAMESHAIGRHAEVQPTSSDIECQLFQVIAERWFASAERYLKRPVYSEISDDPFPCSS